ncbi:hypothetical protein ACIRP4_09345 [Streptomyces bacillaris]|uniref:hypothetical protein n=1 Tax=Streptomyces bacillaris TaxID=68179 RepID=UPI0037F1F3F2
MSRSPRCTSSIGSAMLPVPSTSRTTSGRGGIAGVRTRFSRLVEPPGSSVSSSVAGVTHGSGGSGSTAQGAPAAPAAPDAGAKAAVSRRTRASAIERRGARKRGRRVARRRRDHHDVPAPDPAPGQDPAPDPAPDDGRDLRPSPDDVRDPKPSRPRHEGVRAPGPGPDDVRDPEPSHQVLRPQAPGPDGVRDLDPGHHDVRDPTVILPRRPPDRHRSHPPSRPSAAPYSGE